MKYAHVPPDSAAPPKGALHWDAVNMDAISEKRMVRLSWHIADYLRDVAPDETQPFSMEELRAKALGYMQEAKKLAVTNDLAFAQWSYMRAVGTHAGHEDKVRQFMTDTTIPDNPNDRVDYLMTFRLKQLLER